jgi:hypothetical protein
MSENVPFVMNYNFKFLLNLTFRNSLLFIQIFTLTERERPSQNIFSQMKNSFDTCNHSFLLIIYSPFIIYLVIIRKMSKKDISSFQNLHSIFINQRMKEFFSLNIFVVSHRLKNIFFCSFLIV